MPTVTLTPLAEAHRELFLEEELANYASEQEREAGWPPDARGQENATPLHWAGFHGNAEMARILLAHGAPIDVREDHHDGTPLHWTIYGSEHGWHCRTGDYVATAEALIAAGAQLPPLEMLKSGAPAVLDVVRRHSNASK